MVICEVSSALAAIIVLGTIGPGAVTSIEAVRRARGHVTVERDRLLTEYDAYVEFADRVENVPSSARSDGGQPTDGSMRAARRDDGGMEIIRDAYRDTVMAVPHFETDYDESFHEHMAAELSPEIAAAVIDGTHLTPTVRRSLVASGRSAARTRRVVADQLGEEIADLEDASDQFTDIAERFEISEGAGLVERPFPDLQTRWRRLGDLETKCTSLLTQRQIQLREQASIQFTHDRSPVAVSKYLYSTLDVDFPVLSAGTKLLDRIETEREHTVEALTERRR